MAGLKIKLSFDDEVAEDFRDSFAIHHEIITRCITDLGNDPGNDVLLNEIFRSLHTIKGNINMCQFDELTQFAHSLEDVVSSMRNENIHFTPLIGEAILATLEIIKDTSDDLFVDNDVDYDLLASAEVELNNIESARQEDIPRYAKSLMEMLTGQVVSIDAPAQPETGSESPAEESQQQNETKSAPPPEVNPDTPAELQDSLKYFYRIAGMLERKLPYWKGRIQRTLPLALAINGELNRPVIPWQLEAAVYMHDIAFAFVSESLCVDDAHQGDELQQLQTHPNLGADLVGMVPGWKEAAEIIRQHHEHWNGSGYPQGLSGDNVVIGAQILCIIDAYESMTHPRPDRQYKKSVIRAITEINNASGEIYAPDVTGAFNVIVRKILAAHRK